MQNKNNPGKYFEENSESWLLDAYEQSGYNYPTPYHRLRVLKNILQQVEVKNIIDLGCGGGQLAITLAKEGYHVYGIDQSKKMIAHSRAELAGQSEAVRNRITFEHKPIETLEVMENYDAVTAMGLIGYLPDDAALFKISSRVLNNRGYLIVSFRNRLFNLFSISHRTVREVAEGNFPSLVREASGLYHEIGIEETRAFLIQLHEVTGMLLNEDLFEQLSESPSVKQGKHYSGDFEARQTTPQEAKKVAEEHGFETLFFHGVHPHFTVPNLNLMLPPQVYNRLSDSLIPFESKPVSLLWSSVFIGVFQKQ